MTNLEKVYEFFKIIPPVAHPYEIPGVRRHTLAQLFKYLGYTEGAEIGVESGAYSEVLCSRNPTVHLHCVDAWQPYSGYRDHVSQEKLDGFLEKTQEVLSPYNVTYHRDYSMNAVKEFKPNSLDFVYIDANHDFPHVAEDLYHWSKVVSPGGIISGHDYCQRKQSGYQVHVVEVVKAFTDAYQIRPWFILGAKEIKDGIDRDRPRSFFWIKE